VLDDPRVVLCEDRHDLRTLVRIVFEGEGLRVVGEAADGASAADVVERAAPDIAVVDLAMPGVEGPELVVILRERFPELRIVVYSGSVEPGIGERLLSLGADRFVSKEVTPQGLVDVVREVAATA
jgi:DNA-binding NarL/FixJ family response regulator